MVTGIVRMETSFINSHTVNLGSVLAHYAGAEFGICSLCPVEPVVAADCVSADVRYLKAGMLVRSKEAGVVLQKRSQVQ